MKVIKSGDGRKGWAKECTCDGAGNTHSGCGAVLLVEQADLFQTTSSARDETSYYTTFRCPECGALNDIPDSQVPLGIRQTLSPEPRR